MEFPLDFKSEIIAIPRQTAFVGTLPNTDKGMRWKNKYGMIGANGLGINHIIDGLNEKGLVVGLYYFARHTEYQPYVHKNTVRSLAPWELGTYLLSTCATIDEVRNLLPTIHVVPTYLEAMGNVPPVHYIVHDAQGKSLVIEYIKGECKTYENPIGVMTNSPSFDWHMTNLRTYIHLFTPNQKSVSLSGVELFPMGQGSAFWGLPGDFTPPSRFARLVALTQTAVPVETADEGVNLAINIINNITIPRGSVVELKDGDKHLEYTQWVIITDLTNKKLYFRTYENHTYRFVDSKKISFANAGIKKLLMKEEPRYQDVTGKLQ
jgi:choloylglycine hydrolase